MLQMMITGLICGALLGFVLQRGRFCLTGGFRDMYLTKDNRMFYALLIAIAVQSIGAYGLISAGVFEFNAGTLPLASIIIGSFIFGIGIILAGGCATGTWYRAGEGLIGSWMALAGYVLMSVMMRNGVFAPFTQEVKSHQLSDNSIASTLGVDVWVLIAILLAVVAWVVYKEVTKPKVFIPQLKPKRTGLAHVLFEKRWHPFVTAVLVGLIAVLAWPLSVASGRIFGLGITVPSGDILLYLTTGDDTFLNWGVFLVLGIFLGSFIAAKASNEFRFRMPDVKTGIRSFTGGLLMGCGAVLAGGCSIGNALVMTGMMTWQGWISLVFMLLGTWTATYFVFVRGRKKASKSTLKSA
ncbi:YeeE/YedE family protein [Bacillus sp. AGMB 02131]|uniref:YeeE/YedE family protein n=2 Tax=Peribacillus faecalis TaxID=2772559 RepID=A0A927HAP6_9BACI|nr:YeeE/YedE family protein [Peribacillus faecalis]